MGCIECGHEFDLRGNFWQRILNHLAGIKFAGFWG